MDEFSKREALSKYSTRIARGEIKLRRNTTAGIIVKCISKSKVWRKQFGYERNRIFFSTEEIAWIQSYADSCGKTFSNVVKKAVLEKVEEAAEVLAYQEALEDSDEIRFSNDEVCEMALKAD